MNSIDSVNFEYLQKTNEKILKKLKELECKVCKKIPLPPYKYKDYPNDFFCHSCLDRLKLDNSIKIQATISEMELVNNLIIKCHNYDCNCEFEVKNLDLKNYGSHLKECNPVKNDEVDSTDIKYTYDPENKCCFCKERADSFHECLKKHKSNLESFESKKEIYGKLKKMTKELKTSMNTPKPNANSKNGKGFYTPKFFDKLNFEDKIVQKKCSINHDLFWTDKYSRCFIENCDIQSSGLKCEECQTYHLCQNHSKLAKNHHNSLKIILETGFIECISCKNQVIKLVYFNKMYYCEYCYYSPYGGRMKCMKKHNLKFYNNFNKEFNCKICRVKCYFGANCDPCQFYLCLICSGLILSRRNCPNGHTLSENIHLNICIICERHEKNMNGCNGCNYFVCQRCYNRDKSHEKNFSKTPLKELPHLIRTYSNCIKSFDASHTFILSLLQISNGVLVSGSFKTIKFWDLKSDKPFHVLEAHTNYINTIIQLENGTLVSGSDDKTIKFWDLTDFSLKKSITDNKESITGLLELKDKRLMSVSDDKQIKIWNLRDYTCEIRLGGLESQCRAFVQLDDEYVAFGCENSMLKIWDIKNYGCIKELGCHDGPILALCKLEDGSLVSGSDDRLIKVWDTKNYKVFKLLKTFDGHTDSVFSLVLLGYARLASASRDNTIMIWDVNSVQHLMTLRGHNNFVFVLKLLKNGKLASASDDCTIKIWN